MEERLLWGQVLLPSPHAHPSKGLSSQCTQRGGENITYASKHCLMVRSNIWRAALPPQSAPSPHLETETGPKGPVRSVMGITLPVGAISLGTAGTQEPWRSVRLAKTIPAAGSKGKRAAHQQGDSLPMPVPPVLAHLPQVTGCRRNPASFEPVSKEALPANSNTLCFTSQHGPGQKATSGPNRKVALPHKETQEQPLLFGFQPLLLGFSFTNGQRRQLQLRVCC